MRDGETGFPHAPAHGGGQPSPSGESGRAPPSQESLLCVMGKPGFPMPLPTGVVSLPYPEGLGGFRPPRRVYYA